MPMRAGRQPAHGMKTVASLSQVAAELGCSKARAQRIEAQALMKLRAVLAQRGYVVDDLMDAPHVPAAGPGAAATMAP